MRRRSRSQRKRSQNNSRGPKKSTKEIISRIQSRKFIRYQSPARPQCTSSTAKKLKSLAKEYQIIKTCKKKQPLHKIPDLLKVSALVEGTTMSNSSQSETFQLSKTSFDNLNDADSILSFSLKDGYDELPTAKKGGNAFIDEISVKRKVQLERLESLFEKLKGENFSSLKN